MSFVDEGHSLNNSMMHATPAALMAFTNKLIIGDFSELAAMALAVAITPSSDKLLEQSNASIRQLCDNAVQYVYHQR